MSEQAIAIIGMAGRFPGAASITEYWENLRDGISSIRALTDEELLAAGVTPEELADPAYVRFCPVLDDVDQFDARFFGLNPRDAAVMDPAHRLFMEVAWEALEHAGQAALPEEGAVGVFATSGAPYYLMDHVRRNADLLKSMGEFLVRHTNNDMNFLATRVSYELDLRGPSINIQTACSSALVAVHMACESLRRGECTMALAGGSTVNIPHGHGYMYRDGEILSPDGVCRPFDANSAGTVFGSGGGCVILKPLSAALDAGDTIHAVIRGSAINNDGALRVGFLAPGVEGQAAVVRRAVDVAGVPADSITYVETHGTGTRVGDPIEVEGLTQAFHGQTERRGYCAIGSVKSNIGHLGEAAGIASLIKVVMALKHEALPPSLGYESPNPQIDFARGPFFVNDRLRAWNPDGPRRAGITALGAGGTNCHLILEEAPEKLEGEGAREAQLLVLSAETPSALETQCDNLAQALEDDPSIDLADAAYTLAVGRRAMPHRCALVARDAADAIAQLRDRDPKRVVTSHVDDAANGAVFLFPGGGAQYAGMGRELFEKEEVFRDTVETCLEIVKTRLGRDITPLMFPTTDIAAAARELERPSLSLPALFTIEYALAKLFESWGVEAQAYVGHSMGEYTAACLAGVMTLDEALALVMLRGRLFETVPRGRMLSVPLPEAELRALMPKGLDIAAVNAPALCVASGPEDLIAALEKTLSAREIEGTRVRIDVAAHSSMLDAVLPEFRAFCRTIDWREPTMPFLSNVSGQWITAAEATDPEYWVRHLRSTVRFADCLSSLRARGERVLLEVGPGRTLSTLARAQETPARFAFNSIRHPDEAASDLAVALLTTGRLWAAGVAIDWTALYDGQLRNRIPLPTYPWDHQRHWIDAPVSSAAPAPVLAPNVRRAHVADWFARPSWHQTLPAPPLVHAEEDVLVFCDDVGFGDAIVAQLDVTGRSVVRVSAGPEWNHQGKHVTIRPTERADYERLVSEIGATGRKFLRVIHCWGVTAQPGESTLHDMTDRGFHSLLCFAQALSGRTTDVRLTLDVITNNLQRVGGETLLEPAKALLLGPARALPREIPNTASRAIDVVLPASPAQRHLLAGLIAAEVCSDSADETVAYRGRDRYVQTVESVQLAAVARRVRDRGVYLITGASGGIGYTLARHLATSHSARLVLLGRRSTSMTAARIAELRTLGAEVEFVEADVTDASQVRTAVTRAHEKFGALNGVFHTAGVLGDSLMALKTPEGAERVLAPKVQGTLALDSALEGVSLDFFMLFSSVSSVAGLAGQADYTAANAFLDAFAAERSLRTEGLTIAVNWSAWRDVGMVANALAGARGDEGGDVHPVLGRRLWSDPDGELFGASLNLASQWVLSEHRLRGGRSLMPGTGHLEVARAALAARAESRPLEIRDLTFLSALVVPDDAPREMRVRTASNGTGARSFVIASLGESEEGAPVWQEHVTGSGGYIDDLPPSALDIAALSARCSVSEQRFDGSLGSAHMDFGPRWSNLRSIRYGRGEALVSLELPSAYATDLDAFVMHPALMDLATGACAALLPGYDAARDFYVPLSYTRVRVFGTLPRRVYSHVRLVPSDFGAADIAVFDVTVTDDVGNVLVDIEGFMMSRVTDVAQLQDGATRTTTRRAHASFEPPAATETPAFLRLAEDAIRPAEGMQAIEQILAGPGVCQVFATPLAVSSLLEELRRPPMRATPPAAAAEAAASLTRLPEVEDRLAAHPAVQRAIVVERFDRTGKRHVVAYVLPNANEQPTASELRRFVKKDVPSSSAPGAIILLDAVPEDSSGEVDLSQLHDPFALADDFVAPRTPTEQTFAAIWKDALGVAKVGIRDNFFDLGGHSLLAVHAIVRLERAIGVRLNQAIMVMQTLEQIASEVDRQLTARQSVEQTPAPSAAQVPTTAKAAPTEKSGGFFRSWRNAVGGKSE